MNTGGHIQQVQSVAKATRDGFDAVIGIAFVLRVGALPIDPAQIATGQRRGDAKVWIAIDARQPVFNPTGIGARRAMTDGGWRRVGQTGPS